MKEIEVKDLIKYINPFELKEKPAIAIASDGKKPTSLQLVGLDLVFYGESYSRCT